METDNYTNFDHLFADIQNITDNEPKLYCDAEGKIPFSNLGFSVEGADSCQWGIELEDGTRFGDIWDEFVDETDEDE